MTSAVIWTLRHKINEHRFVLLFSDAVEFFTVVFVRDKKIWVWIWAWGFCPAVLINVCFTVFRHTSVLTCGLRACRMSQSVLTPLAACLAPQLVPPRWPFVLGSSACCKKLNSSQNVFWRSICRAPGPSASDPTRPKLAGLWCFSGYFHDSEACRVSCCGSRGCWSITRRPVGLSCGRSVTVLYESCQLRINWWVFSVSEQGVKITKRQDVWVSTPRLLLLC